MKKAIVEFIRSLPPGPRFILLLYILGFPLQLLGVRTGAFNLYHWLGLVPALVWKGQVWRLLTYGLFPSCPAEWVTTVWWLVTFGSGVGRQRMWGGYLGVCALAIIAGGLALSFFYSAAYFSFTSGAALVFGLLAAWNWLNGKERIVLLGIGETSVRNAAIGIGAVISFIIFMTAPFWVLLAMWGGALAVWLWLTLGGKVSLARISQPVETRRGARLEL